MFFLELPPLEMVGLQLACAMHEREIRAQEVELDYSVGQLRYLYLIRLKARRILKEKGVEYPQVEEFSSGW